MAFRLIDLDTYPRREHYETFLRLKLTYSATVQIDITDLRAALRAQGIKAYPAQIWMLTHAANEIPEFRMGQDADGRLGTWDDLSPLYTTFHEPPNRSPGSGLRSTTISPDSTDPARPIWIASRPAPINRKRMCQRTC